jgi:hypothetical protein
VSGPDLHASSLYRANAGLRSSVRVALIAILTFVVVTPIGCTSMWQAVRRREHAYSVESARAYARAGKCEPALKSLDRAQASLNIGPFARESTVIRARCYEKLGLEELASAHRRLLTDFFVKEPISALGPDESPVLRVADVDLDDHRPPPSSLKIAQPRYNSFAGRSGLVGRVVIAFDLSEDGKPTKIRVLEMPHTLLATWAIEALVESRIRKKARPWIAPAEHYLTVLSFTWRWAKQTEVEEDS